MRSEYSDMGSEDVLKIARPLMSSRLQGMCRGQKRLPESLLNVVAHGGTAIAAIAKNSSFRCPEVGTKFDGQNLPPSRYLHCPADVQHIYLYVDAYIYIYIYTCISVYDNILISNITKHLPVSS